MQEERAGQMHTQKRCPSTRTHARSIYNIHIHILGDGVCVCVCVINQRMKPFHTQFSHYIYTDHICKFDIYGSQSPAREATTMKLRCPIFATTNCRQRPAHKQPDDRTTCTYMQFLQARSLCTNLCSDR